MTAGEAARDRRRPPGRRSAPPATSLAHLTVADLGAPSSPRCCDAPGAATPAEVDDVVLGNCMGPGGDLARVAALAAGLATGPGLTVDRQCGSGLDASTSPARLVRAGAPASSSRAARSRRRPRRGGSWPPVDGGDPCATRARRSPRPGSATPTWGRPTTGWPRSSASRGSGRTRTPPARTRAPATPSRPACSTPRSSPIGRRRAATTGRGPGSPRDRLARLRPAFRPDGTVTAGNSCGFNDGAAAVAVVDAEHAASGWPARAADPGAGHRPACDPRRPGLGLVPAARPRLTRAGVDLDDVDVVEINEAFAGQVLACCDALGLDQERVCADGGAIALGHPWGASGAVLPCGCSPAGAAGSRGATGSPPRRRRRPGRGDGGGACC